MKSDEYINIFGTNFPKSEVRLWMFLLSLPLVLVVGVGALFWHSSDLKLSTGVIEGEGSTEPSPLDDMDPESLEYILFQHATATGSQEVKSFRLSGKYAVNNLDMEMEILIRRPDMHRKVLSFDEVEITYGYDGKDVWMNQSHPVIDTTDQELNLLNKYLVQLENTIPYLSWSFQDSDYWKTMTLLQDKEEGDTTYAVIKSEELLPFPIFHYIDRETGLENYRTANLDLGGSQRKVRVSYNYSAAGSEMPSGYTLFIDGKLHSRATFSSTAVDGGILSILFAPQGETL